jgi:hypothetical protein
MCLCKADEEGQMDNDVVATTFESLIKIIKNSAKALKKKVSDDECIDHEDIIELLHEAIMEFKRKVFPLRNEWKTRVSTAVKHPCKGKNNSEPSKRSPWTGLAVEFSNGIIIEKYTAKMTFALTIKEFGIDKVRNLEITVCDWALISSEKHPKLKHSQQEIDDVLIMIPHSNRYKKDMLEKIARELNMEIKVSLIPRKSIAKYN